MTVKKTEPMNIWISSHAVCWPKAKQNVWVSLCVPLYLFAYATRLHACQPTHAVPFHCSDFSHVSRSLVAASPTERKLVSCMELYVNMNFNVKKHNVMIIHLDHLTTLSQVMREDH